MNEELMKELVSILRAMKEGSPAAWNMLVEQRATYHIVYAIGETILGLALVAMGLVLARYSNSYEAKGDKESAGFTGCCALASFALSLLIICVGAFGDLAVWIAPLGRVLEVMK